jgi:hypothetical protein
MPKQFQLTKKNILIISGASIALVASIITVILLTKKKATVTSSTSTITIPFPNISSSYVVFTESTSSGIGSVLTSLQPTTMTFNNADWCASTAAQTWVFTYVSDGPNSNTKNFTIMAANNGMTKKYLVYSPSTSNKLDWGNAGDTNGIWAMTYTSAVSVHPYIGRPSVSLKTLGTYTIKNVASGLSLTYTAAYSAPSLTVTSSATTQLFSLHEFLYCANP